MKEHIMVRRRELSHGFMKHPFVCLCTCVEHASHKFDLFFKDMKDEKAFSYALEKSSPFLLECCPAAVSYRD